MQSPETLREKRGKGTTNFSHTQTNGCFFFANRIKFYVLWAAYMLHMLA